MAFLCVSQQGEFKNTIKTFWGKSMSKTFGRKSWGKKNFFPFIFSHGVFGRFSTRGVQKHHKKLFGGNTCQKLLAEKVEIFFFPLSSLPSAFVRFSTRGVQKHHKTLFGGSTCQKLLAEKVEEKKLFFLRLFPSIFLIAFLAVSLHEQPKNTIKIFSKIRPENLEKSWKK